MFWLSMSNVAPELEAIAAHTRPWALIKKFWQFSNAYGEYQAQPPSQRRRYIFEQEERERAQGHPEVYPESCL